ncbi:MAG TPA: heme lyase CcmF/NrfE family subunit, partial [Pseudomonadales bacterium]|nr:heme lyase CcmF/NrfE family subunit [Pseudomonadales bacterium]
MIPEIGHFSLALALVLAACQAFFPLYGAWRGKLSWMAVARPAAYGQFAFLLFAFACLEYGFATNDFTVAYIAQTSNSFLPWYYKFSAVWGGHEGSLLLWALVLGGWTAAVATFNSGLPVIMLSRVLGVMGLIAVGFISFLLFTSNPFNRLLPNFPQEGADLNPLLQDPGLIVHPPMLYMGYVGFSVAFAFALAGLLGGRLDSAWARWSRPWTLVAWCFLTVGIALGSWWAYYELGWGGWWFWDPVENASFMPWLAGTALLHSLAVTEKRGVFKAWTVLLAITAFSLSLLGTFLVRSGVLTSVHAFASDPTRGMFVLVFLLIVVGGSLAIFGLRASVLRSESNYDLISREMFLLINNFILVICSITVLLGTLYPIISDVLKLGKFSVGAPYFNTIFVPMALLLLFFVAIGPYSHWKKHDLSELMLPLWKILAVSVVIGVLLPLSMHGAYQIRAALAFSLVIWVALATLNDAMIKARVKQFGMWKGWSKLSRSYKAMVIAHIGLAMSFVGVTFASLYSVERD